MRLAISSRLSGLRASTATIPNGDALGPYTQVNLSVIQRLKLLPIGPFEARIDVVNLFDQVYELRTGTGIGVFAPQFGARRGFYLGLSQKL